MHLGIIGYGNIGRTLAGLLAEKPVDRITLLVRPAARAAAGDHLRATRAARVVQTTAAPQDLAAAAPDLVVECAGQGAVADLVPPILAAGIPTVVASVGALADDALAARLRASAEAGGTQLILPAGAIGGIDLLAALAPAGDLTVRYRGTKPPAAWRGTPAADLVDLDRLTEATVFFAGTARQAARSYPKNANVAATLALAGAGFEATRVELVADPDAPGNGHAYEVQSPLARFSVTIENAASGGNAKTSVATVYSVLREIERVRAPVVI